MNTLKALFGKALILEEINIELQEKLADLSIVQTNLRHSLRLTEDESITQAVDNLLNENESLRKGKEAWKSFDDKYVNKENKIKVPMSDQELFAPFKRKGEDKILVENPQLTYDERLKEISENKLKKNKEQVSKKREDWKKAQVERGQTITPLFCDSGIYPAMQKQSEIKNATELIKKGMEILESHMKGIVVNGSGS